MINCSKCIHCITQSFPGEEVYLYCTRYGRETWDAEGLGLECEFFEDREEKELRKLFDAMGYETDRYSFDKFCFAFNEWNRIKFPNHPVAVTTFDHRLDWYNDFLEFVNRNGGMNLWK